MIVVESAAPGNPVAAKALAENRTVVAWETPQSHLVDLVCAGHVDPEKFLLDCAKFVDEEWSWPDLDFMDTVCVAEVDLAWALVSDDNEFDAYPELYWSTTKRSEWPVTLLAGVW